ncbi:MAG: hypothetical protein ACI9ZF_001874 [Bradyrhizobium sp.]|jgi:hypothetical protein
MQVNLLNMDFQSGLAMIGLPQTDAHQQAGRFKEQPIPSISNIKVPSVKFTACKLGA